MITQRTFNTASTPISACVRSCAGNQALWMYVGSSANAPRTVSVGNANLSGSELRKVGNGGRGDVARGMSSNESKRARWRYDSMGVLH
jgi:hypothetical protein